MPVIRLEDVPEIAEIGPDQDTLVMKKAIGSKESDPAFAMPDETPSLSITYVKIWGRLQQITCEETDRAMFIVDGDGIARVGDDPPQRSALASAGPGCHLWWNVDHLDVSDQQY